MVFQDGDTLTGTVFEDDTAIDTAPRIASQGSPPARLRSALTLLPLRGKPC
jgi:hypothetical protein